jgi:hypothetical protein
MGVKRDRPDPVIMVPDDLITSRISNEALRLACALMMWEKDGHTPEKYEMAGVIGIEANEYVIDVYLMELNQLKVIRRVVGE